MTAGGAVVALVGFFECTRWRYYDRKRSDMALMRAVFAVMFMFVMGLALDRH